MKTIIDLKNEKLSEIESDPNFAISKNVLIGLEVLTDDEYERTIDAILSLKNHNWQESLEIHNIIFIDGDQGFYVKKIDHSLLILFTIKENNLINVLDVIRLERIEKLSKKIDN